MVRSASHLSGRVVVRKHGRRFPQELLNALTSANRFGLGVRSLDLAEDGDDAITPAELVAQLIGVVGQLDSNGALNPADGPEDGPGQRG